MDIAHIILIASVFGGFLMAFSLGANDVANSMASAVGAKAISIRQAVIIASVLNFLGAVFLGSHVASTIYKGIINAEVLDQRILMLGMFAALLSSGLWVLIATYTALPVSSTHSIVGSIVGFGLATGGYEAVYWSQLFGIIISWILSPFLGALIAYAVFMHIRRTILRRSDRLEAAKKWIPRWVFLTLALIILSFIYQTPFGQKMGFTWLHGVIITLFLFFTVQYLFSRIFKKIIPEKAKPGQQVEELFRKMQIGTACYVALSQGANDVANAIGPVIAIYYIATTGAMNANVAIPLWILLLGGAGIATGILVMGHLVMGTVGERITKMNNSRGFSVAFSSATTVLMASNLGLPVSTTHATVGSVVGVGLARGFQAVDFRVLGKILIYWVLTVPIAGFSCIAIYQILRLIFS